MESLEVLRNCLGERTYADLAEDVRVSPSSAAKWFMNTEYKKSPSPSVVRAAQLVSFIRQHGLEPPPPII